METTKTAEKARTTVFKRRERIGHNFLDVRKADVNGKPTMTPVYVKITNYDEARMNKAGETNPFFDAVNLETGEEGAIFLDGGLKAQFSKIGLSSAVGRSFEIMWKGQERTTLTIEGRLEDAMVNKYDVFLIEDN